MHLNGQQSRNCLNKVEKHVSQFEKKKNWITSLKNHKERYFCKFVGSQTEQYDGLRDGRL